MRRPIAATNRVPRRAFSAGWAGILLTCGLSLWVAPLLAQIERVTILVDGMTWTFCGIQAERALRRLDGVAAVRILAAERKAEIDLKPRALFSPGELRSAIEGAGQKVREFQLVLCATLEKEGNRYYLQPAQVAQRFVVTEPGAARNLETLIGPPVCIRGRLTSTRPPLALEIIEVAPLLPAERRRPSSR